MADPPQYPDGDDSDEGPDRKKETPRWLTALGILMAVVVIGLVVFLHLAGIVGPGLH
jgi:hypothetical protein